MSYEQQGPPPQGPPPRQVRVPFLRRRLGAGDVVARMTRAIGIEPCEPCERRRAWLNRWLQFHPRR